MKKILFVILALCSATALAAELTTYAAGFQGPENLAFDGRGSLYLSDANHLWLLAAGAAPRAVYTRDPGKDGVSLGGVALGPEGKVYFSAGSRIMILDPASGQAEQLVGGLNFANGICLDDSGNLFIADSNARVLYDVPAGTAELKVLKDKAGWVNGMVWSRMDNTLYFTRSFPGEVAALKLGPGLKIEGERRVASFPEAFLDDLTIDARGNLYVCEWGGGKLVRVTPDGKKEVLLRGLDGPSAVEFETGADSSRLFICIKGKTFKFTGATLAVLTTTAEGYRQPFQP